MSLPLRPIDWEDPFGTDWVGIQASLVYAPTFSEARIEIQRRPLVMPNAIKKTGLLANLPFIAPKDALGSVNAIRRILQDADWDYWTRYQRRSR